MRFLTVHLSGGTKLLDTVGRSRVWNKNMAYKGYKRRSVCGPVGVAMFLPSDVHGKLADGAVNTAQPMSLMFYRGRGY